MRKRAYLPAAVVVIAVVGIGVMARPFSVAHAAHPSHFFGSVTFPDNLCGFNGTTTLFTRDNFGVPNDGGSYDSGQLKQTFIADNGRGVRIFWDAGRLQFYPPVTNSDGTTTIAALTSGQNARTQAVNGPVLEQSTGRAEFIQVDDANGNPISFTAIALAGPENNLTGAPDCSVIGPYLAGA
jgi:hypothetical protein